MDSKATPHSQAVEESLVVAVQRSRRRKRTISWEIRPGKLTITVPATLSSSEERAWVEKIQNKVRQRLLRARRMTDQALWERCQLLWHRYLPGQCPTLTVEWSDRQARIHASCSNATGEIRVSGRMAQYPSWVLDYILVHELAHLIEPGHNGRFWQLVHQYPFAERARGFLEACDLGFAGSLGERSGEPAD